jgi:hypothetical protein
MHGLFKDYVDYCGAESISGLSEMLIEEHHAIANEIDHHSLTLLTAPQRLVFPDFVKSKTGAHIPYIARRDTIDLLTGKAEELGLTLSWMVRNVIFRGLAVEMVDQSYKPGHPSEYIN